MLEIDCRSALSIIKKAAETAYGPAESIGVVGWLLLDGLG
jgi:hypothetical protein